MRRDNPGTCTPADAADPTRLPTALGAAARRSGFTLIELLIAASIMGLGLYMALSGFSNAGRSAGRITDEYALHMKLRQATDRLLARLFEGTEVVQPAPGQTLPYVVLKDLVNNLTIIYCEKAAHASAGPYQIVKYTDTLTGRAVAENREVLCDGVKEVRFTAQTRGLVLAHVTMVNNRGRELSGLVEVPMMNLGAIDR